MLVTIDFESDRPIAGDYSCERLCEIIGRSG
jgi:hypothetical protein